MTEPTREKLVRWAWDVVYGKDKNAWLVDISGDGGATFQHEKYGDEPLGFAPLSSRDTAVRVVYLVCKNPDARHRFNHYLRRVLIDDGIEEIGPYVFATATAKQFILAAYFAMKGSHD